MSKDKQITDLQLTPEANEIPLYADKFVQYADKMLQEIDEAPSMPATEKLARVSGAHLYKRLATGKMHPTDMQKFLITQFTNKTPSPIQQVEQTTKTDLRILFSKAIEQNPNILEMSTEKALKAREAIQEKLSLPPTLQLDNIEEAVTGEVTPRQWSGEPDEIKQIRDPEITNKLEGRRIKV